MVVTNRINAYCIRGLECVTIDGLLAVAPVGGVAYCTMMKKRTSYPGKSLL